MLGRRSQRDFEDEIKSHIELEAERLRAQGMSPDDAERAARRRFGNVGVAEDRFYHGQRFASVQDALRDMKHAWRSLLRTPGFLVTSVITLALAIGAVAGMFSVVNNVVLKPLPFPDSERLVVIAGTAPGSDMPERFGPGGEFYLHWKERSQLIDGIFSFGGGTSTLRTDDRVERIPMAWPTPDIFATLGVRPQLGRLPVPEDGDDVRAGQVVLRLRQHQAGHRHHARRLRVSKRADAALGAESDSGRRCPAGPGRIGNDCAHERRGDA